MFEKEEKLIREILHDIKKDRNLFQKKSITLTLKYLWNKIHEFYDDDKNWDEILKIEKENPRSRYFIYTDDEFYILKSMRWAFFNNWIKSIM